VNSVHDKQHSNLLTLFSQELELIKSYTLKIWLLCVLLVIFLNPPISQFRRLAFLWS